METITNSLFDTVWEGKMNVPNEMSVELYFNKDQFVLKSGQMVLEIMSYSIKDGEITIKKVGGGSPCNDEIGVYNFRVEKDRLYLKTIKDDCGDRSTEFSQGVGFKKVDGLKLN